MQFQYDDTLLHSIQSHDKPTGKLIANNCPTPMR
jgi:hypothetical protein